MKLIHTADIHLDSNLRSRIGEAKASERKNEILDTFIKMIDYAAVNDIDAVLIAGDLFDTLNVSATTRSRFVDAIKTHSNIAFFYLKGNHDFESLMLAEDEKPANLFTFDSEWKYYVLGRNNNIVISGIEITSDNYIDLYSALELDIDVVNVVMLHGMASRSFGDFGDDMINISKLANRNIDYLALGHIHSHQEAELDSRALMVYPGCLDPRGFDEVGEHGFVLINIDEETEVVSHEFVPFASRQVYEADTDITGCMSTPEIVAAIKACLNDLRVNSSDMVKVILTGSVDIDAEKDVAAIQNIMADNYWYLEVRDKSSVNINYENYSLDKSLKGAFVREVYSHEELTDEEKNRIISYGLTAIEGGEVEKCV